MARASLWFGFALAGILLAPMTLFAASLAGVAPGGAKSGGL